MEFLDTNVIPNIRSTFMKKMLCLGIILLSPLHLVGSEQPGSQEGAQTRPSLPLSNKAARKYRQQHGISPKSAPKKVIKVVNYYFPSLTFFSFSNFVN